MKGERLIKAGINAYIKPSDGRRCLVCGKKGFGILFCNTNKSLESTFIHIDCLREFFISRCVYNGNHGYARTNGICPICNTKVNKKNYHCNDFHIHKECMEQLLSKDFKVSDEIQAAGLTELV